MILPTACLSYAAAWARGSGPAPPAHAFEGVHYHDVVRPVQVETRRVGAKREAHDLGDWDGDWDESRHPGTGLERLHRGGARGRRSRQVTTTGELADTSDPPTRSSPLSTLSRSLGARGDGRPTRAAIAATVSDAARTPPPCRPGWRGGSRRGGREPAVWSRRFGFGFGFAFRPVLAVLVRVVPGCRLFVPVPVPAGPTVNERAHVPALVGTLHRGHVTVRADAPPPPARRTPRAASPRTARRSGGGTGGR